jgi:YVTN family beta-propeller protein
MFGGSPRARLCIAGLLLCTIVSTTCAFSDRSTGGLGSLRERVGRRGAGRSPARHDPNARAPARSKRSSCPCRDIYRHTRSGRISPRLAGIKERVYVPNSASGSVDVIDPRTFRVVRSFRTGAAPHHVTPSWDMRRLYVDDPAANSLTVIDPRSGRPRRVISVTDPYNLYFTPDGDMALVVAERYRRIDFRDPHTWRLVKSVSVPSPGVDHLDFSGRGDYLVASTEFSGYVYRINVPKMIVTGRLHVGGLPVDVKVAPNGAVFYVANQGRGGVSVIDGRRMRELEFIPTGAGAHGLCVSRNTRFLYVSNRLAGTISVISFRSREVVHTWDVGGSPDMLQVSPDGRQLWASNRLDASVSVISTATGRVLHVIPVGAGPHGLSYFPNPGRFSVGHNGVFR